MLNTYKPLNKFLLVAIILAFVTPKWCWGQNVSATWGANANTAWYTTANWVGSAYAGSQGTASSNSNVATFTSAFTGTAPGINLNTNSLNLGGISIDNTRTIATNIGNSSGTANTNQLRLYGTTINSIANTILRNNGSGLLTLNNGNAGMTIILGNSTENIITIDGTGGITIAAPIADLSGNRNLTKTGLGSGVLTLSASNTFTGNTTISAGTLALSGAGSISSSPQIIIASGAKFDVTGLTTALSLGASQSLRSSATGSNTTATVTVSSTKGMTLSAGGLMFTAFGGGTTAPLTVAGASAGAIALNSAPVTVTTTTALSAGTYVLVNKSGSATGVTGTSGTLTINGSGLASGCTGSLSVSSGQLILNVITTPGAPTITSITPGNNQLAVNFTAPSSDGGSAITNYKYSTDGGSTFTACSPAQTSSPILITGLTNGVPYNVQIKAVNIAGDGVSSSTSTETPTANGPIITISNVSASPIDFGITYGLNATSSYNYTITGSNLTSDVVVTAPTNFEVSKDDNTYSSSVSYIQSGGALPLNSFVYVRFNPSSINGINNGNITHTSSGATTENVSVTGIAIATEPTVSSSITFGTKTTNSIVVNFTGGNGSNRILAVKSESAVSYTPVDGTVVSGVNSVFTSATDQGSGNRIVYSGTGNTVTLTGLTSNTAYHFALFEFNEGTGASQNYLSTAATANSYIYDNAVYASDNLGTDLTQDFSSLASSSTSSVLPTGWFISTSNYDATAGSATSAGVYSCGTGTNSDRSIGTLATNATIPSLGFKFINSTSEALTSIKIEYYGEQWRLGATNRVDKMSFAYSTDATSLTTGTWNTVTALDFTAPITTGTVGSLDGNVNANRTLVTSTITNLNLSNSGTIWFRWLDFNASGNDDLLAIDDIVITPFSNTVTTSSPNPTPGTINNLNINNDASLTGDVTVTGKLNIESGKKITLNGNTLTINGTVTGNPTIVGDATSSIILGGTGTVATLNFDQTTLGTTNKLKDVTINRTGTTVTLGNALQIADNGTVTVSAGTLASGGNLTLTSTLTGTARIAELGAGASITGNVEVQRYMVGGASSQRGWRCMSTPVSGATYAQLVDDIFITGPGGTASGFDANGSNSSVMYYEESATRGWKSITNPTNTWAAGKGALVFFRGDRTQTSSLTNTNVAPNSFALDYSGNINSGDVTVPLDFNSAGLAADQGWNLIGNPYPSQIDWASVNRSVNTDSYYYILNPNTKNYVSQNTGTLAIGQAFFVLVDAATSITFQENDKTANTGTAYFKTAVNPLTIKMKLDNIQYDVATLNFESNSSKNYVFKEDALKLKNSVYNLAFVTPNNKEVQYNVVNYLGTTGTDTFDLNVTSTTNTSYTLNFTNFDEVPLTKAILLVDKLNNNLVNLRITPDYTFTINNSTSNTFGNRFALVITDQYTPLPVKLTSFAGKKLANANQLSWTTASEKNMVAFEIERSNDGKNFEPIGLVKPTNTNTNNNYTFNDITAQGKVNYYRLKMVDAKNTDYSGIVSIANNELIELVEVYPNPAENVLSVRVPQNAIIHNIKVIDLNGTVVIETSNNTQFDVSALSKGVYLINVQIDDEIKTLKFVKK